MRRLQYYVDTPVWNFLLEEERTEHQEATERFFEQVKGLGAIGISEVVLREIERAPETRREALGHPRSSSVGGALCS